MMRLAWLFIALGTPVLSLAWYGHLVRQGNVEVFIEEIPTVTQRDTSVPVRVRLTNGNAQPITGTAEVRDLVDDTHVVGEPRKAFRVQPKGETTLEFAVSFGKGTYSALYPVHVYVEVNGRGEKTTLHAVRIVETRFEEAEFRSETPTPMQVNVVPTRGGLPLWTLRTHRVAWRFFDEPVWFKKAGWTGSDRACRANMHIQRVTRGDTRTAISMHPPWAPRPGTIFCDYLLKLPDTKPIRLVFANAIRDHNPEKEPPSDGVLFRVWAAHGTAGTDARLLYENFTDSKRWVEGEADLSEYAGQTILLRLESHPGPKRDTTCDQSFWAEPTVIAGERPRLKGPSFKQLARRNVGMGRRILAGTTKPDNKTTFLLSSGKDRVAAVLAPSPQGILDGVLTLVGPSSAVSFRGFRVTINGQNAVRWPTPMELRNYEVKREGDRWVHVHTLAWQGRTFDLTVAVWADGSGLRIAFRCPERITGFSLGPADQLAPAVYYGHGYRIVNPRAFRAGFGGHNLSTSHVGCDFAGGMSVVQAVDVPPDYFEVDPDRRVYALHSHLNGTLTLVASEKGAFDCAIKYRPLYDKKPAGGVQRLAGRMCFDIWGGRYADIADRMERMIRFGLTDSFLTVHVWQRWGYDYRLPDIWPPNPDLGTIEDMRKIARVCKKHDIPWGLHDNYIDFYPDATGYTYDNICFTADGRPIKAWYNRGRDAQSYRWRPDRFMPFLKRNLKLIKDGVAPTHYFIDVFASVGCFDFYDHDGNFHPSVETRQRYGEAFAWIRQFLGGNAPTTSEAGHDQLIAYLDGADCQFLGLTSKPSRFLIYIPCDDWERVPWFDAVNHHRFILHGVGYSSRYQGGQSREARGINSDDYISAEILTGHALMTDAGSWGRPAVRKYWLAQDVARNLALRKITDVQFADGDMHRIAVTWDNGTRVWVNRGRPDWTVEGRVLPQYGYLVVGRGLMSAIEKRNGVFCESCVGPSGWYCNARTHEPDAPHPISVGVENFKYLGGRKFTWDVVWQADKPAPRDMTVFVHFYGDTTKRSDRICFQDDHYPSPSPNQWRGTIRYSRTITLPDDASGEYQVGFGLYDQGGRLRLRGQEVPNVPGRAYWVGVLQVKRSADGELQDVHFVPAPPAPPARPRVNVAGVPVDFGFAVTDGAFRVQKSPAGLRLIPLPDSPPFSVTLRLDALDAPGASPVRIVAIGDDGQPTGEVAFTAKGREVTFQHDGKAFAYDLVF